VRNNLFSATAPLRLSPEPVADFPDDGAGPLSTCSDMTDSDLQRIEEGDPGVGLPH